MPAARNGAGQFLDLSRESEDGRRRLAARASVRPARQARGPGAPNSGSSARPPTRALERRPGPHRRAPYRQHIPTQGWARGSLVISVRVGPSGTGGDTPSAPPRGVTYAGQTLDAHHRLIPTFPARSAPPARGVRCTAFRKLLTGSVPEQRGARRAGVEGQRRGVRWLLDLNKPKDRECYPTRAAGAWQTSEGSFFKVRE